MLFMRYREFPVGKAFVITHYHTIVKEMLAFKGKKTRVLLSTFYIVFSNVIFLIQIYRPIRKDLTGPQG